MSEKMNFNQLKGQDFVDDGSIEAKNERLGKRSPEETQAQIGRIAAKLAQRAVEAQQRADRSNSGETGLSLGTTEAGGEVVGFSLEGKHDAVGRQGESTLIHVDRDKASVSTRKIESVLEREDLPIDVRNGYKSIARRAASGDKGFNGHSEDLVFDRNGDAYYNAPDNTGADSTVTESSKFVRDTAAQGLMGLKSHIDNLNEQSSQQEANNIEAINRQDSR